MTRTKLLLITVCFFGMYIFTSCKAAQSNNNTINNTDNNTINNTSKNPSANISDNTSNNTSATTYNNISSTMESNTTNTTNEPTNVDLNSYIGNWQSEQNKDVYLYGGVSLNILEKTSETITFTLTAIQAPPANRIAIIENITAKINSNQADFIFADDGWGNAGTGTLLINDNNIYVKTELTTIEPTSNWNLSVDCNVYKLHDVIDVIDLEHYMNVQYDTIKSKFGEETQEGFMGVDGEYHIHGPLSVSVDETNGLITSFELDFTHSGSIKYKIAGIDSSFTKEMVTALLGKCAYLDENTLVYMIDYGQYNVEYHFDNNNRLLKAMYRGNIHD